MGRIQVYILVCTRTKHSSPHTAYGKKARTTISDSLSLLAHKKGEDAKVQELFEKSFPRTLEQRNTFGAGSSVCTPQCELQIELGVAGASVKRAGSANSLQNTGHKDAGTSQVDGQDGYWDTAGAKDSGGEVRLRHTWTVRGQEPRGSFLQAPSSEAQSLSCFCVMALWINAFMERDIQASAMGNLGSPARKPGLTPWEGARIRGGPVRSLKWPSPWRVMASVPAVTVPGDRSMTVRVSWMVRLGRFFNMACFHLSKL